MLNANDGQPSARLRRVADKNATQKMVAAMLDGANLNIRTLKAELVITNPADPEQGEVRIEYATGHVSRKREVWEFFGPLQGFQSDEPDGETHVSADTILSLLGYRKPENPEAGTAGKDSSYAE